MFTICFNVHQFDYILHIWGYLSSNLNTAYIPSINGRTGVLNRNAFVFVERQLRSH
jgi:hypothetical protein